MMHDGKPHSDMQGNTLAIHLLGTFHVAIDDRAVPPDAWRLRKASHLVKLLALAPGHALHREQLADLLWPDIEPDAAYNNLRFALHVARHALDGDASVATILPMRQQMLALQPSGPLYIDVEAFQVAAARCQRDPTLYHAALDLYLGDLLPEDRYEEWAAVYREALRATYQSLALACARVHEEQGEYASAIPLLQRVVKDEPSHEDAHIALMRLHARAGQRAEARSQFARLRTVLRQEMNVDPSPASQQLYAAILAGQFPTAAERAARALPQVDTHCHHVPEPLTRFIGRERERAEVGELLATHRLVTLIGTGGCGKTRLALTVAKDQERVHHDGVWLVELAALVDPARVPQAVAQALGVREEPSRVLIPTLTDFLQHKSALLVVDNCEHVLAACTELAATLLTACPNLRLLATSREALHVPGEVVWRVPSLTIPEADATLDQLEQSEAAQLFLDRVRWRQPDFALTAATAPAVAAICRHLDGLPQALELAAGRTSVLTITQLVTRLDDALRLLTGGAWAVVPRQQTLRATLDWSYALLNEQERALLGCLAIFAGGCDLDAVEAVCHSAGITQGDVLNVLAQLVDKSLVPVVVQQNTARYRLLETVRQYARERLQTSGNMAQLAQQHADYYLILAEAAGKALVGAAQATWLTRLEMEHDNLRAALRHALAARNVEQAVRFVGNLWRFWYARGYLHEGSIWLAQVLTLGRASAPQFRRTTPWLDALFGAGRVQYFLGDYSGARALFAEMRTAAEEIDDAASRAGALTQLGNIALYEGDVPQASHLYAEGLALRRALGDHHTMGTSLGNLGWVALLQADFVTADDLFTECLALHRQSGDSLEIARALTGLGLVATGQRHVAHAQALFAECLTLCQTLHAKRALADCLDGLAALATVQGQFDRALRLAGAASALEAEIGNPLPPVWQERRAHALAPARQALGDDQCAALLLAGRTMLLSQVIAEALHKTALV